ncbi:MAG: GGDEF domain-containing protein [Planctomycetes bacterium]|nr:GGDEF domain-containing protein [Planctomycetota bacterium]
MDLWPIGLSGISVVGLPVTVALGAVAIIGYLFGQRTRKSLKSDLDEYHRRELDRAVGVARKIEAIANTLRQDLASHHARIDLFKQRLRRAQRQGDAKAWDTLCTESEAILGPTMQFAHQLSHAYDRIRQQSSALETFTHGRTDPLTGVGNVRALEQHLQVLLAARAKGNAEFVVALIGLDRGSDLSEDSSSVAALPVLSRLAGVIRACMRDSDFVARLGGDEFVVVMPRTTLAGAGVFGDRLRKRVARELSATVSCGATESRDGDDLKHLLSRADSALYSAKAAGKNHLFVHTGAQIREHLAASHPTVDDREASSSPVCHPPRSSVSASDSFFGDGRKDREAEISPMETIA